MNREAVLKVADAIAAALKRDATPALGFNMAVMCQANDDGWDRTGHKCGTVGCIAGWSRYLQEGRFSTRWGTDATERAAQRFLGLDNDTAVDLFYGRKNGSFCDGLSSVGLSLFSVKPRHAIRVLRHLADTGKVDWHIGAKS